MTELLIFSICVSLFCGGLFIATQFQGMIFSFVPDLFSGLPVFIQKPLFDCLPCMASVWSLVWWLLLFKGLHYNIIFCIFISACLNKFISYILENHEL